MKVLASPGNARPGHWLQCMPCLWQSCGVWHCLAVAATSLPTVQPSETVCCPLAQKADSAPHDTQGPQLQHRGACSLSTNLLGCLCVPVTNNSPIACTHVLQCWTWAWQQIPLLLACTTAEGGCPCCAHERSCCQYLAICACWFCLS